MQTRSETFRISAETAEAYESPTGSVAVPLRGHLLAGRRP